MSNLSADSPRKFGVPGSDLNELPVAQSTTIYEGSGVGDNGSGYARQLTAGDPFRGWCLKQADNSSGSNGAIGVKVRRYGTLEIAVTGASGVGDVGDDVYLSDGNTATKTKGTNTRLGVIIRHVSGSTCIVAFAATRGTMGDAEASITSLTDNSGGSASNTLAAITAAEEITDSSGGVDPGDDTIAAITAAEEITDSSGGVDPGDDTIAAITAAAEITDSSGGVDPGDDTIAAVTNLDTLTNSTGGAADDTLDAVTQQAGGAGVELTDGDPAKINNNFTELADQVATQAAANTALLAAIAQLSAKQNTTSTAVTAVMAAIAQLAAKQNTTSTAVTAVMAAIAQLAAKQNTTTTAIGVIKNAVASLAAKVNQLIDDLEDQGVLTAV